MNTGKQDRRTGAATRLLTTMAMVTGTLGGAIIATASPAQAAGSVTIPDGPWAGDVPVTVTSEAPYLRITLTSGASTGSRVLSNPRPAPTEHDVPTWGIGERSDQTATIAVAECATSTGECTPLGDRSAPVRQTSFPEVVWEHSGELMFNPEETVSLTMTGNEGGVVSTDAYPASIPAMTLENGVRRTFDLSPIANRLIRWGVGVNRCNPILPQVCGRVGGMPVYPVAVGALRVSTQGTRAPWVSADPASPYASTTATVRSSDAGGGYSMMEFHGSVSTWELVNSAGTTVVGPVQYADTVGDHQVTIDPAARSATTLPEGDYTIRYRQSITKGDLSRTATAEEPLRVGSPPELPVSAGTAAQVRPQRSNGRVQWGFSQQYQSQEASGRLVIRDLAGQQVRVLTGRSGRPNYGYEADWDGKNTAGVLQPVGRYQATAEVTDIYGQVTSTTVPIDIQTLRTTHHIGPRQRLGTMAGTGQIGGCASVTRTESQEVHLRSRDCDTHETGLINYDYDMHSGVDPYSLDRMIRVRAEVYGEATAPTSSVMRTSWRFPMRYGSWMPSPDDMSGPLGWHYGGWVLRSTASRAGATNWFPRLRLSLEPTNGFDVRYVRGRYTYREWYTPGF